MLLLLLQVLKCLSLSSVICTESGELYKCRLIEGEWRTTTTRQDKTRWGWSRGVFDNAPSLIQLRKYKYNWPMSLNLNTPPWWPQGGTGTSVMGWHSEYRYTTTLYFVCNLAAYLKKRIRSLTCIIHTYYSNVTFGCMLWAVLNKGGWYVITS